jgi:hypothetical protein
MTWSTSGPPDKSLERFGERKETIEDKTASSAQDKPGASGSNIPSVETGEIKPISLKRFHEGRDYLWLKIDDLSSSATIKVDLFDGTVLPRIILHALRRSELADCHLPLPHRDRTGGRP